MQVLTYCVIGCLFIEAALLMYLAVSAKKFIRKMTKPGKVEGFKTNIFIESALSMDL